MTPFAFVLRSLRYYWRTNLAVVLGVATAVSVLAGALLVGDSVRGSLRDLVLQRLGRTDRVVSSASFFREALAGEIEGDAAFGSSFQAVAPLLAVEGSASDPSSGRRASRVQVYGVDDRFWRFHGVAPAQAIEGRDALVSRALADEIGVGTGAAILVRLPQASAIPIESLHARKDDLSRTLRLTVRAVADAAALGEFSLRPQQGDVRAVFVPLARLQKDLGVEGRVNVLLFADRGDRLPVRDALPALVRKHLRIDDVGLRTRSFDSPARSVAIESPAGLIDAPRADAIEAVAKRAGLAARPVFTYLATSMRSGDREIPYSLVTAIDLDAVVPGSGIGAGSAPPPIVINEWAARELGARSGDPLTLEYYLWEDPGILRIARAEFRVAAVVPIAGLAADRNLTPEYPGISDAQTFGDWDPPFPIDLSRVRPADEEYWKRYRTTPKAFIPYDVGRELWQSRHGNRTSVRIDPRQAGSPGEIEGLFRIQLAESIDPFAVGLTVHDARAEGLAASRGATDFGEYFTYFSFFLVVSALVLAALFFRLGVEQRAKQVGLLRSVGFTTPRVRRLFALEGLLLVTIGSAIGLAGAIGYGSLMMTGLRTWWSGAVGTTALTLHVAPLSLAAGAIGALVAALACIWWTLRALSRVSERGLLAGSLTADREAGAIARAGRWPAIAASVFYALGVALVAASGALGATGSFFGAGSAILIGSLCAVIWQLRRPPRSSLRGHGWAAVARLGLRNAADRPGRSVLAIGVIASAAFILIAVEAFRRDEPPATDRRSGTGGYALVVDLAVPIAQDPNSREGRETLGLADVIGTSVEPLRVRSGDDASCLNLYEPRNPRILGVGREFMLAGRFAFGQTLAATDAERANPWLLLEHDLGGEAIPVIADANSITYVLHKKVGDDVVIDRSGAPLRLRIVAALADSIFQGELLMSAARFTRAFPEHAGYQVLLVDTGAPDEVAARIESRASDLGADATSTAQRLAEFHRVENTYLSTFQTLGGLGLLVGTVGLAAVLLRNVMERRKELALLGAAGYRRPHILAIIVAENALLVGCGLAIGAVCALVAILPAASDRGAGLPISSGAVVMLVAVLAAGLLSSFIATRAALRAPLLESLRGE